MTEQTQPTDAELEALAEEHLDAVHQFGRLWIEGQAAFARAVLAKWGTPAGAGEVASLVQSAQAFVLDPTSLQKKLHLEAQAWGPLASTPQPTQAQAGAVPLTDEQRKDLLAASFCIAAVGDPTATIKPGDAERIIDLLHQLGGIRGTDHG